MNCVVTGAGLEVLATLDGPANAADAAAFGHLDPADLQLLITLLDRVRHAVREPRIESSSATNERNRL